MQKHDVIAHFGSITAAAKALGVSHAAVSKWGNPIPELRARQIDELTNGILVFNKFDYAPPIPANPTAGPQAPALEQ